MKEASNVLDRNMEGGRLVEGRLRNKLAHPLED
jgi:hypothetical protein